MNDLTPSEFRFGSLCYVCFCFKRSYALDENDIVICKSNRFCHSVVRVRRKRRVGRVRPYASVRFGLRTRRERRNRRRSRSVAVIFTRFQTALSVHARPFSDRPSDPSWKPTDRTERGPNVEHRPSARAGFRAKNALASREINLKRLINLTALRHRVRYYSRPPIPVNSVVVRDTLLTTVFGFDPIGRGSTRVYTTSTVWLSVSMPSALARPIISPTRIRKRFRVILGRYGIRCRISFFENVSPLHPFLQDLIYRYVGKDKTYNFFCVMLT